MENLSFNTNSIEFAHLYLNSLRETELTILEKVNEIEKLKRVSKDKIKDFTAVVENTDSKIQHLGKILKRISKGETDPKKLKEVISLFDDLKKSYSSLIGNFEKIERHKKIKETTLQAKQTLHWLSKSQRGINKRIEILEHRLELPHPPGIIRFDRWLERQKTIDKSQFEYVKLAEIIKKISAKNAPIEAIDLNYLKCLHYQNSEEDQKIEKYNLFQLSSLNIDPEEKRVFCDFLINLIEEIEGSRERKMNLLAEIDIEIKSLDAAVSEENQIRFAILLQQVIYNPFEISIELPFPLFSEQLQELISQPPRIQPSQETLAIKNEGLKRIRQAYLDHPNNKGPVLISGAGPTGLMLGLIYSLEGVAFNVIERRDKKDRMRENIVLLGHEEDSHRLPLLESLKTSEVFDSADMKLLNFFGVTDRLVAEGLAEPYNETNPTLFSAKIKDLQLAMIKQTVEIGSEPKFILYNTEIAAINVEDQEMPSSIVLRTTPKGKKGNGEEVKTIHPMILHVTEGYHASTRDLLGIETIKLTKASPIVISSYRDSSSLAKGTLNLGKLAAALPSVVSTFIKYKVENEEDDHKRLTHALDRGEVFLQTPDTDYLYVTTNKKEQNKINKQEAVVEKHKIAYESWVAFHGPLIKKHEGLLLQTGDGVKLLSLLNERDKKQWMYDPRKQQEWLDLLQQFSEELNLHQELKVLQDHLSNLEKSELALKKLTKKILSKSESRAFIFRAFERKKLRGKKEYHRGDIAYVRVQKAEQNFLNLGQTLCYVGGDAESSTDPLSGGGFRTGVLRASLAAIFLKNTPYGKNPFTHSIFQWISELASRSMREEGINKSNYYNVGVERLERYLEIAEEHGVINAEKRKELLRLEAKAKIARDDPSFRISEGEGRALDKILGNLKSKYDKLKSSPSTIEKFPLSKKQKKSFDSALKALQNSEPLEIDEKQMKILKEACSVVALYRNPSDQSSYMPEAWFVYLSLSILQMLPYRIS